MEAKKLQSKHAKNISTLFRVIGAGVGLVAILALVILMSQKRDRTYIGYEKAQMRADQLALQLINARFERNEFQAPVDDSNLSLRGPASTDQYQPPKKVRRLDGEVGRDPWGFPFRYFVQRVDGGFARVAVISAGPDHQFGINPADIAKLPEGPFQQPQGKDDLGVIMAFRMTEPNP